MPAGAGQRRSKRSVRLAHAARVAERALTRDHTQPSRTTLSMCGIVGFLCSTPETADEELRRLVSAMAATLRHRGPDGRGVWTDARAGVALGHTRLAILDLSPAGNQPMQSSCGRYVLVYNGEVYNHRELRKELEGRGRRFRGRSDTETLLEAIAEWGLEPTLRRCVGMFAFALWDRHRQELTLVRDRLGIKPLYYGWCGGTFFFASELKALRVHPDFTAELDREAVSLLLRHNYVPAPWSIYRGIAKLRPGTVVTVRPDRRGVLPQPQAYWSLEEVARAGREQPFRGSEEEAVERLEELLGEAVRARLISDVPLGAFLSGGIDSSAVVALMQKASDRPVRTFSIGFHEKRYNEAPFAKSVARHLGTDHVEYYVTPREALDVIPRLPTLYDEPFADSSQVPTFLVSQVARQSVTVCLSGDGGDELFGGYTRYAAAARVWRLIRCLPAPVRRAASAAVRTCGPLLPGKTPKRRALPASEILRCRSLREVYVHFMSHWSRPGELVVGGTNDPGPLADPRLWSPDASPYEQMMYVDTLTYLPDDILVKVDRASMGVSLEARVPLLDHRVVEFAWSLSVEVRVRRGRTKWPLRQLLARHVPPALFERPKTGFGIPIDEWLRGELRDWAESLLDEHRLRQEGVFRPEPIRQKWLEHVRNEQDWHYYLWDVLMFQAWLEESRRTMPRSVVEPGRPT